MRRHLLLPRDFRYFDSYCRRNVFCRGAWPVYLAAQFLEWPSLVWICHSSSRAMENDNWTNTISPLNKLWYNSLWKEVICHAIWKQSLWHHLWPIWQHWLRWKHTAGGFGSSLQDLCRIVPLGEAIRCHFGVMVGWGGGFVVNPTAPNHYGRDCIKCILVRCINRPVSICDGLHDSKEMKVSVLIASIFFSLVFWYFAIVGIIHTIHALQ